MKIIKRVIFLFSFILLYIIIKEFLELYVLARSFHPIIGYLILITISGLLIYFVAIPIYRIIKIPRFYGPTTNKDQVPSLLKERIDNFRTNEYLINSGFDFSTIKYDQASYKKSIETLKKESERIRKIYVSRLFYSSTVSQNGFIDAVLILSASINLIKEIFILYNGRVSNKDLSTILKKVYYAMAIGGSESVEIATKEIMHSIAFKGLNSVPFIDKITGSMADGFINSVLLTRVAFITENYCTMLYIESEKSLYPSTEFIIDTTKHITSDIRDKTVGTLKKLRDAFIEKTTDYAKSAIDETTDIVSGGVGKTVDYGKLALNPAAYVLNQSIESVSDKAEYIATGASSLIRDGVTYAASPFAYVLLKSTNFIKKDKQDADTNKQTATEVGLAIKERSEKEKGRSKNILSKLSNALDESKILDKTKHLAAETTTKTQDGLKQAKSSLKKILKKPSDILKKKDSDD